MAQYALATYQKASHKAAALVLDGKLYDIDEAIAAGAPGEQNWGSKGLEPLISDWATTQAALGPLFEKTSELVKQGRLQAVAESENKILAPFQASRIFCAASNFVEHANEMGTVLAAKSDSKPYMFLKLSNTVIGSGMDIRMPPETSQLDWEVELAAIIGKRAKRVSVDDALDYVAGYSVLNDITARDLNVRSDYPFKFDWFQGKCHDTFAPFGPWIVPASAIPDPQAVNLRLTVNDQVMQEDSTRNMIWTVREQIAYLSTIVTLEPGDVVATGTPTGVGKARGIFLKPGDVVTTEVVGIGKITNRVVAD